MSVEVVRKAEDDRLTAFRKNVSTSIVSLVESEIRQRFRSPEPSRGWIQQYVYPMTALDRPVRYLIVRSHVSRETSLAPYHDALRWIRIELESGGVTFDRMYLGCDCHPLEQRQAITSIVDHFLDEALEE